MLHRGEMSLTFNEASWLLDARSEIGGHVSNACPAHFAADELHPVHRDGHAKAVQFQRGAESGSAYPEAHAIGEAFSQYSRVRPAFDAVNGLLPVRCCYELLPPQPHAVVEPHTCACRCGASSTLTFAVFLSTCYVLRATCLQNKTEGTRCGASSLTVAGNEGAAPRQKAVTGTWCGSRFRA